MDTDFYLKLKNYNNDHQQQQKPWAQRRLESGASLIILFHLVLSRAELLGLCMLALHQSLISSLKG